MDMFMKESVKALVSVIITTYHNEGYLPRAIESILHQSYPEIEVIVVDDNPPESRERRETEKIMSRYPQAVYMKHPENRNGAAARNTGITAARGKYIAFLDNDDFYFTSHIADCVNLLETHPDCGCVLCSVVKICEGLCWDLVHAPSGDMVKTLLFSETALGTGSNLFVRADLVRKINGFDESFQRHQDVEFGLRLFSRCRTYSLDEVQIVKEMGGFSNAPDYERFLKTKQQLWRKFRAEINALTEDEKNRYFSRQFSALLYTACKGKNKEQIKRTIQELKKYRPLNGKEKLLVILSIFHLFVMYEEMKKIIKRIKSPKIYEKTVQHGTPYDVQILQKALCDGKKGR